MRARLAAGRGGALWFHCPGCDAPHAVHTEGPGAFAWNGDTARPTLSPSVLVRSGHHASGRSPTGSCWCTYRAAHPDAPPDFACTRCHAYVSEGRIQFLSDSTHALAGQTVDLPELGPEPAADLF